MTFFILAAAIALADFETSLTLHPEHPGAQGSLVAEKGQWRLHYDFTNGGHGLGMIVTPRAPIWADTLTFEANHGSAQAMCVLVCDSTGQWLRKVAEAAPGKWRSYRCNLHTGWIGHWGGANDGVVHQPIRQFEINLDRAKKEKGPLEVGDSLVRNIGYEEIPADQRRKISGDGSVGVRYLVTDFRPGDVYSAGPRAFFRGDLQRRWDGGELEVDFARHDSVTLFNEIPIWGTPEELVLTVEAPVESAGLELALGCRSGGPLSRITCGRLRPPCKGSPVICQTFSVPWMMGEGWSVPGKEVISKRLMQVIVRRGTAAKKNLKIRLVSLEAVVRAGGAQPPIVAVPPKGEQMPQTLQVGFLNLGRAVRERATARIRLSDWQGHDLGVVEKAFPVIPQGARAFVSVALPKVPEYLNFVSYRCELLEAGRRDFDIAPFTTSWTRPLADAGLPEKNPDVVWGFGVYVHRSEDPYAYSSGYASPLFDNSLAVMEKRAAMAQAAGIKWERAEFKPGQANPARGQYDFSYWDKLFDILDRHGLSYLGLWSHYFPTYDKGYTQQCYDDYLDTLKVAAKRYRGRVTAWEIWNEPNIHFWSGPKDDYAKLLNATWDILKAEDPQNRVVGFSMAGLGLDFIDKYVAQGVKFDDISVHPYRGDPDERVFMADLASVTNRSRGTRTWLTEMGWPTGCDRLTYSEIVQAAYYARAYLTAAGCGAVHSIYGYDFVDDGFNVLERENNFGIIRRDFTPKPAYRGLAKVCRTFTKGKASLEPVPLREGGDIWIFRMGGQSAVWARHDTGLTIKMNGAARVSNLMDETLAEGVTETRVKIGPLKVVFLDRDIVSVAECALPGTGGCGPIEF